MPHVPRVHPGITATCTALLLALATPRAMAGTSDADRQTSASIPVMGSLSTLDGKDGFRDAFFGSPLSSLGASTLVEDAGLMKFYQRPGEDLRLGAAIPVSAITYGFYEGRLAVVLIDAHGLETRDQILAVLMAAYGTPIQDSRDPANLYAWWMGERVRLSLRWRPATESIQVNYSGMGMMQEMKKTVGGGL